jgi:hypothetical protein
MTISKSRVITKTILIALILAASVFCSLYVVPAMQRANANDGSEPFDHTACQYPTRTTNPADGCDNSDPCDPLNVYGGSGECKTYPPSGYQMDEQPTDLANEPQPEEPKTSTARQPEVTPALCR